MPEDRHLPDKNLLDVCGLLVPRPGHRLVRRLRGRYQPSAHGGKVWDACYLLMDYLLYNPLPRRRLVMDLGCGWGPVGVFCALRFQAKATGTDRDPGVFPYLEMLAALNGVQVQTLKRTFNTLHKSDLQGYHCLLGSDICFWENMTLALTRLIGRALRAGVRRIAIADPGRPPFMALAEQCLARHADAELLEWRANDPRPLSGYILQVRG